QSFEAEAWHLPDRLRDDRLRHLRASDLTVCERDRNLDDLEAGTQCPVSRLDLEGVALRVDGVEIDRLENRAPIALEAACQVADLHAQDDSRIEGAAGRNETAEQTPVPHASAGDVPRAEGEICPVFDSRDQAGDVVRIVREVAVHLQYELPVTRERVSEAGQIGRTEALLALAVEDVDVAELPGEAVGELAGPAGGVLASHPDAYALVAERAPPRQDVLALVVA